MYHGQIFISFGLSMFSFLVQFLEARGIIMKPEELKGKFRFLNSISSKSSIHSKAFIECPKRNWWLMYLLLLYSSLHCILVSYISLFPFSSPVICTKEFNKCFLNGCMLNEFQGREIVHVNKINVLVVDITCNMKLLSEMYQKLLNF